jgi:hypothetical protein
VTDAAEQDVDAHVIGPQRPPLEVEGAHAAVGGGGGIGKLDKEVIIREAVRRVMEELSYKTGR